MKKEIVIIGAGAAGIGMGCALHKLGINDFVILEKGVVGESFFNWPKETRLITPSFTTNGFGFPDINAIAPDTSPAYTFAKEHLSGEEYGEYLQMVADHYELPIEENCHVTAIKQTENGYCLNTTLGEMICTYIVMATGEFQNPNKTAIAGAHHGLHYGEVDSFAVQSDTPFVVIGGNESGVDAAINLLEQGNQVELFTTDLGQNAKVPDPSIALSPITKSRLAHAIRSKAPLTIHENKTLRSIDFDGSDYTLSFEDGSKQVVENAPILATGFLNAMHHIQGDALFSFNEDGIPLVNEHDESTIAKNVFLVGPSLRQNTVIFCYIYKFRQRFAVVAELLAKRMGVTCHAEQLEVYKRNQMYLPNAECCDVVCDC
ncbi:NAD(P)-binding domain-containing protein [Carnobacteriaceae bacterium zg-C25]|nr:NAD(P)-binding domain-containing protein [Carnobacteriaceae bacterium zg-C25]